MPVDDNMNEVIRKCAQVYGNNYSLTTSQFLLEASRGNIEDAFTIHKFGRNSSVGTTVVPVCNGGNYRMPTGTATLEAVSTSVSDTAAGVGGRQLTLEYLDTDFNIQTATITMNGTAASTTVSGIKRLYRAYVSKSGRYANQSQGSHVGTITIREQGAGQTWAVIGAVNGIGLGQSQIGAYTVPAGYTAYILSIDYSVDSNKFVNMYFFSRSGANVTSAPFSALRIQNLYEGITGSGLFNHSTNEAYTEYTDMGFFAEVSSATASVSVEFELILIKNQV